ncbi:nuclear factor NF-kappa-B family member relish [Haematobia irritans]|uniref:nuclear factor NF-kappa-B family member relish n=1 Tax=Haematobia irritans TaxID=7368 RepID=UPI003F4F6A36
MLPRYFQSPVDKDIVDMDTQERIRYISESSMSGTSGYSTTSPGPSNSPNSTGYSPVHSPESAALQADFSNLAIPPATQHAYQEQNSSTAQYLQLQNVPINQTYVTNNDNNNLTVNYSFGNLETNVTAPMPINYQNNYTHSPSYMAVKPEYTAEIRITEQPVEKFRFRYKSEMHGTHGSLNGANSHRNTKSFPEIQLCGYTGDAVVRCSLFQTNRNSPHSHQLVVRKDDHDKCDPHEVKVSQATGYFAEFKNMGIIHTAKKFIIEELLKKKRSRKQFELGRRELTTKEEQELFKEAEKEAKDMNLNQVRLCFEAFHVENNEYTPIAEPVYSNPINNRKSAQTGDLRITRLSIATGSVTGGEDLILLVEKVSKKNIKVRFYEMKDDELLWESYASFRESDVHHQYAIVCRTPAYKDKDIDKPVEVFIELVRPSDDERSDPPVSFRYKPRDAIISRKRRRTCSTMSVSSGSNSGSLSSGEIPKTIQEQQQSGSLQFTSKNLSEEIERLINSPNFKQKCREFSEERMCNYSDILKYIGDETSPMDDGTLFGTIEKDGAATNTSKDSKSLLHYKKLMISKKLMDTAKHDETSNKLMQIFNKIYLNVQTNPSQRQKGANEIIKLFNEYSDSYGESLMHELVANDKSKNAMRLCQIIKFFELGELFNTTLNNDNQTVLHYACLHDRSEYIRPLLQLGCNPNAQDKKGNTALHIAVHEGHMACLECILKSDKNFDLNVLNDDGFTPLHLAIRANKDEMASKIILDKDKSVAGVPNSKDGNNALHIVIQQQNFDMVKLILENQSSNILHSLNTARHTPLDVARQLATTNKTSGKIWSLLQTYSGNTNVVPFSDVEDSNSARLVIKEEEQSSSSAEDADDDSSLEPMVNIPPNEARFLSDSNEFVMDIEIKTEDKTEKLFTATELENALEDSNIFSKLCEALNTNQLWKNEIQIPTFYINNPETMLKYIKRNIESIDCHSFALTLQKIDKNLLSLIKKR